MRETIRWRVAHWLSDHCETLCWGDLVLWALGSKSTWDAIWDWKWETFAHQKCNREEGAYCGKCITIGRLPQVGEVNDG